MQDYVHIDVKSEFLYKTHNRYYPVNGYEATHRMTHSKRYITKVMFLQL